MVPYIQRGYYLSMCSFLLLHTFIEGCGNTSYKQSVSNDNCITCPENTVSNMNRTKCVCKDGYYKRAFDNSEVLPCYGKLFVLYLNPSLTGFTCQMTQKQTMEILKVKTSSETTITFVSENHQRTLQQI